MKNLLIAAMGLFACGLQSQTTLTQSFNEPVPGDLDETYYMDTAAYTNGLPINVTGNAVIWNFTDLVAQVPLLTDSYLSNTSVPSASNYAGCNLVLESGGFYSYLKSTTSPTTQTELLGITINSVSIELTNSAIMARYPISYGSGLSDNLSGTFSFSVNGTCTGVSSYTADGSGTLNLPDNLVFTNVVRIKSVQSLSLSASLFPGTPAIQAAQITQTVYSYYSPLNKFPLLNINYSRFSYILSPTPTITAFVTGNADYLVTGIGQQNQLQETNVSVYPNPFEQQLRVTLPTGVRILETRLYNALGQLVLTSNTAELTNLNFIPGIYTLEIRTDQGDVRKKIIRR